MKFAWLTDSVTRDVDLAVRYTLLWGLDAMELRMIGASRVPHVNEEKLRRRLLESELDVASIQPGMFEGPFADRAAWLNEIAEFSDSISFCGRTGCRTIVVSAFQNEGAPDMEAVAEAFRRLSDAAARTDIHIAVQNESGGFAATGERLAALLNAVDRPNIAAAWNPANAVEAGEDAEIGARSLEGRVALIRCRDVRRRGSDQWATAPLGEGVVGWRRQLELLPSNYEGVISLEAFAEPMKKQALRDATWLLRTWREVMRQRATGSEDDA